VIIVPSGGGASWPMTLPASPSFAGVQIFSQSAMLAAGVNPLGALTSNGIALRIDVN
jgi:hypothetical protein